MLATGPPKYIVFFPKLDFTSPQQWTNINQGGVGGDKCDRRIISFVFYRCLIQMVSMFPLMVCFHKNPFGPPDFVTRYCYTVSPRILCLYVQSNKNSFYLVRKCTCLSKFSFDGIRHIWQDLFLMLTLG